MLNIEHFSGSSHFSAQPFRRSGNFSAQSEIPTAGRPDYAQRVAPVQFVFV